MCALENVASQGIVQQSREVDPSDQAFILTTKVNNQKERKKVWGKLKQEWLLSIIIEWHVVPSTQNGKFREVSRVCEAAKKIRTSFAHFVTFFVSDPPILVRPAFNISTTQGEVSGSFNWPLGKASARSPKSPIDDRSIFSVRSWSVNVRCKKVKTELTYGKRISALPPVFRPPIIPT